MEIDEVASSEIFESMGDDFVAFQPNAENVLLKFIDRELSRFY